MSSKIRAILKSILPFVYCFKPPIKALKPTTNKEYPVANFSSMPYKYIKIGTARIYPPLPMSPKTTPMSIAKKQPSVSIKI